VNLPDRATIDAAVWILSMTATIVLSTREVLRHLSSRKETPA
jgi:hypothetical protein